MLPNNRFTIKYKKKKNQNINLSDSTKETNFDYQIKNKVNIADTNNKANLSRTVNEQLNDNNKASKNIIADVLESLTIKKKQLLKKTNEKFKFDWDIDEDTYQNNDILFGNNEEIRAIQQSTNDVINSNTIFTKPKNKLTSRDYRLLCEFYNIKPSSGVSDEIGILRSWDEAKLDKRLIKNIELLNYTNLTPIQRAIVPQVLANRNIIGIAETGSGKTAAYCIPLIQLLLSNYMPRKDEDKYGPYAVILSPTRELAQQIQTDCLNLANNTGIRSISIVGGKNIENQRYLINQGIDILVATPGRLIDCLSRAFIVLLLCKFLILDEADKMIEADFNESIKIITSQIGGKFQFILVTATISKQIKKIELEHTNKFAYIEVNYIGKDKYEIEQKFIECSHNNKIKKLLDIITKIQFNHIIIFTNFKRTCEMLYKTLVALGFNVDFLHGGKMQETREKSLEKFKQESKNILVATDVASRGIDISNVTYVINYELPTLIETYKHRIGRTGRAGKTGTAISLYNPEVDKPLSKPLILFLTECKQFIPPFIGNNKKHNQI